MLRNKVVKIFTWPAWGLMALMAATRFHHFGNFQTLPDASLAVFFLAGLVVPGPWLLPLLLTEAGLIDYLAIHFGGVSGWCVTPAYLFLIPTYAVMWAGGRWSRRRQLDEVIGIGATLGILVGVTVVAFLLSNSSFYLLSGYFDTLGPAEYSTQIATYLPRYVFTTLGYTALILAGRWLWHQFSTTGPALLHK